MIYLFGELRIYIFWVGIEFFLLDIFKKFLDIFDLLFFFIFIKEVLFLVSLLSF